MIWSIVGVIYILTVLFTFAILSAGSRDDDLFNRDERAWYDQQQFLLKEKYI